MAHKVHDKNLDFIEYNNQNTTNQSLFEVRRCSNLYVGTFPILEALDCLTVSGQ